MASPGRKSDVCSCHVACMHVGGRCGKQIQDAITSGGLRLSIARSHAGIR